MARIIYIGCKCSDMFNATVEVNGETKCEYNGYVPRDIGIGGDDYIELAIDLDSGQIVNWQPVLDEQLQDSMKVNENWERVVRRR